MGREDTQAYGSVRMEPFTLITDIVRNLWVAVLGAIACALLAYVMVSSLYVPRYTTSATFAVSSRESFNSFANLSAANEMAQTFERILNSNVLKKTLKEALEVDSIDGTINTNVLSGTNLLVLKVTDDTPKEAYDLILAIMEHYDEVSYYVMGNVVMDVLSEPAIPLVPDNPLNPTSVMKKAFLAGGALVVALFGVLSFLSDTIKREEELEQKLDAKSLGQIPFENKYKTPKKWLKRKKVALLVNSPIAGFAFVESYKKLALKLDYQMAKTGGKVLAVTSVSENEGKSTLAANLAITLAEQDKRVLLIEGDLRRPSQFLIFGKEPTEKQEIGEFLKGKGLVKNVLQESGVPRLFLMIGRNCYSTSTEMLQSAMFEKLLEVCKRTMDYVIIDTPPAGLMGDAEVIGGYADAMLLVVKQNHMLAEDINDALDAFREHHVNVLGVVLNGVRTLDSAPGGHYYGNYGRYGRYSNYSRNRED